MPTRNAPGTTNLKKAVWAEEIRRDAVIPVLLATRIGRTHGHNKRATARAAPHPDRDHQRREEWER